MGTYLRLQLIDPDLTRDVNEFLIQFDKSQGIEDGPLCFKEEEGDEPFLKGSDYLKVSSTTEQGEIDVFFQEIFAVRSKYGDVLDWSASIDGPDADYPDNLDRLSDAQKKLVQTKTEEQKQVPWFDLKRLGLELYADFSFTDQKKNFVIEIIPGETIAPHIENKLFAAGFETLSPEKSQKAYGYVVNGYAAPFLTSTAVAISKLRFARAIRINDPKQMFRTYKETEDNKAAFGIMDSFAQDAEESPAQTPHIDTVLDNVSLPPDEPVLRIGDPAVFKPHQPDWKTITGKVMDIQRSTSNSVAYQVLPQGVTNTNDTIRLWQSDYKILKIDPQHAETEEIGVGFTWSSPDGERQIAGKGGAGSFEYYQVVTIGSSQKKIIPIKEIESQITRDKKVVSPVPATEPAEDKYVAGFSWESKEGKKTILGLAEGRPDGWLEIQKESSRFNQYIHKDEIADEVYRDTKNLEFQRKWQDQETETSAKTAAKKAEYESVQGFTDDMDPKRKANALKALNKLTKVNNKIVTRKKMIEDLVTTGATTGTKEENRVQPMSRTAFNRATQAEQDAHEKRIRDAGIKRVYSITNPANTGSWYDITKTEYDYANYLIDNTKAEAVLPATEPAESTEAFQGFLNAVHASRRSRITNALNTLVNETRTRAQVIETYLGTDHRLGYKEVEGNFKKGILTPVGELLTGFTKIELEYARYLEINGLAPVTEEKEMPAPVKADSVGDDIDSVDGYIIPAGKFAGFKAVAQKALGVNSPSVNIHGLKGLSIGVVHRDDFEKFETGDASVFQPSGGWKTTFSNELKVKLGLTADLDMQATNIPKGSNHTKWDILDETELLEERLLALNASLEALGWQKEGLEEYRFKTIKGGFKGTINPEGNRKLRSEVKAGLLRAMHGDKELVSIPFSETPEDKLAKKLDDLVMDLPGATDALSPSQPDTVLFWEEKRGLLVQVGQSTQGNYTFFRTKNPKKQGSRIKSQDNWYDTRGQAEAALPAYAEKRGFIPATQEHIDLLTRRAFQLPKIKSKITIGDLKWLASMAWGFDSAKSFAAAMPGFLPESKGTDYFMNLIKEDGFKDLADFFDAANEEKEEYGPENIAQLLSNRIKEIEAAGPPTEIDSPFPANSIAGRARWDELVTPEQMALKIPKYSGWYKLHPTPQQIQGRLESLKGLRFSDYNLDTINSQFETKYETLMSQIAYLHAEQLTVDNIARRVKKTDGAAAERYDAKVTELDKRIEALIANLNDEQTFHAAANIKWGTIDLKEGDKVTITNALHPEYRGKEGIVKKVFKTRGEVDLAVEGQGRYTSYAHNVKMVSPDLAPVGWADLPEGWELIKEETIPDSVGQPSLITKEYKNPDGRVVVSKTDNTWFSVHGRRTDKTITRPVNLDTEGQAYAKVVDLMTTEWPFTNDAANQMDKIPSGWSAKQVDQETVDYTHEEGWSVMVFFNEKDENFSVHGSGPRNIGNDGRIAQGGFKKREDANAFAIEMMNQFVKPNGLIQMPANSADLVVESSLEPEDIKPWQKPNVVFRELVDFHARILGYVFKEYDGKTKEDALDKAQSLTPDQIESIYPGFSNINSRMGATDANGNPLFAISPNLRHVHHVLEDRDAAMYTWGDIEAGERLITDEKRREMIPKYQGYIKENQIEIQGLFQGTVTPDDRYNSVEKQIANIDRINQVHLNTINELLQKLGEDPAVQEPHEFRMGDLVEYEKALWEVGFINHTFLKGTLRLQKNGNADAKQINHIYPEKVRLISPALPREKPAMELTQNQDSPFDKEKENLKRAYAEKGYTLYYYFTDNVWNLTIGEKLELADRTVSPGQIRLTLTDKEDFRHVNRTIKEFQELLFSELGKDHVKEKLDKIKEGLAVVMDDESLDLIGKIDPEAMNDICTFPNPDRLGTKDLYLAGFASNPVIKQKRIDKGLEEPDQTTDDDKPAEKSYPAVLPHKQQLHKHSKYIGKLFNDLGIAEKIANTEDYYGKVFNEPWMPLTIERHGDLIYLTHYYEQNGDLVMDGEMVFQIYPETGHLMLKETAVPNPIQGGELRGRDATFANMFARNLKEQGFGDCKVVGPRNQDPAPETAAPPKHTVDDFEPNNPMYYNLGGTILDTKEIKSFIGLITKKDGKYDLDSVCFAVAKRLDNPLLLRNEIEKEIQFRKEELDKNIGHYEQAKTYGIKTLEVHTPEGTRKGEDPLCNMLAAKYQLILEGKSWIKDLKGVLVEMDQNAPLQPFEIPARTDAFLHGDEINLQFLIKQGGLPQEPEKLLALLELKQRTNDTQLEQMIARYSQMLTMPHITPKTLQNNINEIQDLKGRQEVFLLAIQAQREFMDQEDMAVAP